MATVTYIRESKQSISAMKGVIDYCCQDKKSMIKFQIKDLSAELTVMVKMLFQNFLQQRNRIKRRTELISISMFNLSHPKKILLLRKLTRLL